MKPLSSTALPSDIALRGIAIVMVVMNHASITDSRPVHLGGGLNILLLLSGYSFARFVLSRGSAQAIRAGIASFAWRIWLPTTVVILLSFAAKQDWSWKELLFISNFWTPRHISLLYIWFPQVLLQMLLLLYVLSFIPGTVAAVNHAPRALALVALALSFVGLILLRTNVGEDYANRTLQDVAWNFVLGWAAWYMTQGEPRTGVLPRIALLLATIGLSEVAFGWGADVLRAISLPLGLALLLFVPRVRLPAIPARVLLVLSQATFAVFLAHVFFLRVFDASGLRRTVSGFDARDTALATVLILLGSVALWLVASALARAWRPSLEEMRRRPARAAAL